MQKHGSPRPRFGDEPSGPSQHAPDPSAPPAAARLSLGRDHALLEADAAFEDLIGLDGDALRGRSLFDFIYPSERQAVADRLQYAVACRHDRIGCLALMRPDAHPIHIDAVVRYESAGGEGLWLHCSRLTGALIASAGPRPAPPTRTSGSGHDVDDTPATPEPPPAPAPSIAPAPDGLDDASRQVLRLEEVRGGAMLVVGEAGRIVAGTSAAAVRTGWMVDELTGRTIDDLFALGLTAREQLHDAVRAGRRATVPASVRRGAVLASLDWLPAQRAGYGFLSILNVHPAAGADEHAHALTQAVRLLWHDAGEAVTALAVGTDSLASLLAADARRPAAAEIAGELRRHARLVRQAVAEVRCIEHGTPVELEPVAVNEVIEDFVAAIRTPAAAAGVTITTDLAPDLHVLSTELRVRSIVRNLVTNARQVLAERPGGGTIEVTTVAAEGPDGPGVQLVVRDDGPGMSEALARVAFEPGLSDTAGGTGVGLNLVRQFIVASGGAVQALTRPGAGTAFVIWLPTVPSDSPPRSETRL